MSVDWDDWRRGRLAAATAPHGTAALDRTEWLDDTPRALAGLPGTWRVTDGVVLGEGLEGPDVRLATGEDALVGELRVRSFDRRGNALRVFDPASANRTSIVGIAAYDEDAAWRLTGRFRPAAGDRTVDVVAVDGVVTTARVAGEIDFDTPEGPATLTVTATAGGGHSAVLGDATNGVETYRFRFVDLGSGPDGDAFTVDFNRLHLPPCAFSAEYVCPTPLPGNRWEIPVRAGEREVVRRDGA
ncbi:MAG: DUF1684 domain-containing protein [Microbacterium sp.]